MVRQQFNITRRRLLKAGAGASLAATVLPLSAPTVLAANTIKIGYVSPKTGPLAPFAEADDFVLADIRKALKSGIRLGSTTYDVDIVVKDSQSNANRASDVAKELINKDKVSMIVVAATSETNNPVGTLCELEGVPCLSSVAPWQTNFISRQEHPNNPTSWSAFKYTYHYFWGLEDIIAVYFGMWSQLDTNKTVGALFPNDNDGNAWADKTVGFPSLMGPKGFKFIDTGRYQNLSDDFSAQIASFKTANAEILTGVVIPPDFPTFWNQAQQKGYKPKIATIAKALLFPTSVQALGKGGHNITTEVWWTPNHPYRSSLTAVSAREFVQAYEQGTGKRVDTADWLRALAL